MNKISIYQIKDIENVMYAFRDYDEKSFNLNDYKIVAEKEIEIPSEWKDAPADYIFEIFNKEACKEFKMHSISVSDIIEIDGKKFYVQNSGFKELV